MTDARAAGGLFFDEHVGGEAMADLGDDCEAAAEAAHRDWMDSEREAEIDRLLKEKREAAAEIERLRAEVEQARGYLIRNVLAPLAEKVDPLDSLLGVCTQVDNATTETTALRAERDRLREALRALTDHYAALVNCGDCGHWNPEGEPVVKQARAALGEDAT